MKEILKTLILPITIPLVMIYFIFKKIDLANDIEWEL